MIAAVSMVKDEEDVIYWTIRHLVGEGVELVVVADNMSTDGTRAQLEKAREEFAGRCDVVIKEDLEVGYYQSQKMTVLAREAHALGATWVLPFDADEIWYSRGDRISEVLRGLDPRVDIVRAPLYNHFGTALDGEGIPFDSMAWRQKAPGVLPKVVVRWDDGKAIHQGNHGADGWTQALDDTGIELRHFPYRSWEHFVKKARNGAAAYAATDLPVDAGAHWRSYGRLLDTVGEERVRHEVFEKYFWFLSPTDEGLVYDPAPFLRWERT
jgi:hypothetical protein